MVSGTGSSTKWSSMTHISRWEYAHERTWDKVYEFEGAHDCSGEATSPSSRGGGLLTA